MKYQKKVSLGGEFVRKGEDIKDGDTVKLLDEGTPFEGQYGTQNVFKIDTRNGEKVMSLNQTSINSLVDHFGEDASNWVGKEVVVHAVKQNVAGKFIMVYYVAPEGYVLGENGFEQDGSFRKATTSAKTNTTPEADEIDLEDVPF